MGSINNIPTNNEGMYNSDAQSDQELTYRGFRHDALQDLYYWNNPAGGTVVSAYDSISGRPMESAYYTPGSKFASAFLDPETNQWLPNETIEVTGNKPPEDGGFLGGVLDGAIDLVGGAYHAVRHPIQTVEGIGHMVAHPIETAENLGHAVADRARAIWSGDMHAAGHTFTDIASLLIAPEADASDAARASELAGAGELEGFERVPGTVSKITRNPDDVELFNRSQRFGTEYATWDKNGSRFERAGSPTEVRIAVGPDVSSTLHTHPTSGVALPSTGDVTSFAGKYAPETTHSILGRAFPGADKLLEEWGLEPSGRVMKSTFTQEKLEAVAKSLSDQK